MDFTGKGRKVMDFTQENAAGICRQICMLADEMRDTWLQKQSRRKIKEIMSLTISQQRMLHAVWRMIRISPQGVMLKELADSLSLSCSAVSVMVDSMVRRGIFERDTDENDRRKIFIRITAEGMRHAEACEAGFGEISAPFFSGIPDETTVKISDFLNKFQQFFTDLKKEKTK